MRCAGVFCFRTGQYDYAMSIRPRCITRFRKKEQGGIVLQKKHIVIGIIAAVVIIVTAVLAGMKLSRSQQQDTFTPDLEQGTSAWSGDQLPDKSADSGEAVGIKIPGYPSISLPANQQTVQVALLNPEGNPCYFTLELVLSDTDEVLYTSKQVPPGQMIEEITLTRPLEAGQYNATLRITTASLQDGSAMNGANVETIPEPKLPSEAVVMFDQAL